MPMRKPPYYPTGPTLAALLAIGCSWLVLRLNPERVTEVFTHGAGWLAGLFLGVQGVRTETGWALPFPGQPVLVTSACAATDFFMMTASLLGWHFMRRAGRVAWLPAVLVGALFTAFLITLLVNALRIAAVAHAHHWIISRMPASYDPFLHLLTGAAVFLPALIALNVFLESHGRPTPAPARD